MADFVQAGLWLVAGGVVLFWIYPSLAAFCVHLRNPADKNQAASGPGKLAKDENENVPTGSVLVVRLTDDGELCERSELADITYAVRNRRKGRPPEPVLAVWYVHGWRHGAKEGDPDLLRFRDLVKELAFLQALPEVKRPRHVVGIYVGWNGATGPGWLQFFTFWNRKRAADRISQSSIVTKVLSAAKHARRKEECAGDMTILIGHSFGARILFSAISHLLIDEVERAHPGHRGKSYGRIEGPADLILLLNPAFEASMFTALHALRRDNSWESAEGKQQPRLVAISSEDDSVTTLAYPLGQACGLALRERERQTLGNYGHYVTHDLVSPCEWMGQSHFWYDHFEASGLLLLHRMDRKEPIGSGARHWGNPFVVARTTRDVIKGHNGIWDKDLMGWIVSFVGEMEAQATN